MYIQEQDKQEYNFLRKKKKSQEIAKEECNQLASLLGQVHFTHWIYSEKLINKCSKASCKGGDWFILCYSMQQDSQVKQRTMILIL